MRKIFKMAMALFVLTLFLALPGIGLAQEYTTGEEAKKEEKAKDGEEKKTLKLEEIVVTATRTKTPVMDTPSNISVITATDLEAMDAKNVTEALKKLPGIYYTNASGLEPKISLRGTRIGMSGGALVLVNGIPVNMGKFGYTDFEAIPVDNIERVEVVKGPMSALYGGDSARGVINIITKRGGGPINGKISTILGSY
ncbi:MAG: TonB-dependent receptor, partial [Deltaproteobacteria bacterium]|nr:TonB-dependent receptor [Deltaproteobacteria bacterium]